MTSFLLIISLLLHVLLFIIIYYLYQHIQTIKSEQTKEINELLRNFLQEIKLENKNLQRRSNDSNNPNKTNINEENQLDNESQSNNQRLEKVTSLQNNRNKKDDLVENMTINEHNLSGKSDELETSMRSQVHYLYGQDYSLEEIAKQLNCSTTEVQLLIKFSDK